MVRINLLPPEKRRKPQLQLKVLYNALLFLLIVSICGSYSYCAYRERELRKEISLLEKELAQYQAIAAKVKKIRAHRKRIEERLDMVRKVVSRASEPIRFVSYLARSLPRNQIFLTKVTVRPGEILLEGNALDYGQIAVFMKKLEGYGEFRRVVLLGTEMTRVEGYDLVHFSLRITTG